MKLKRTPPQRHMTFRFTPEVRGLLVRMAQRGGCTMTDILERAIRELAKDYPDAQELAGAHAGNENDAAE
jgi:hypothetical protein